MAFQTVLFDFDGTLFDSASGLLAAWRAATDSAGIAPLSESGYRALIGPPFAWSLEHTLKLDERQRAVAEAAFKNHYNVRGALECLPYPGVCEMLSQLHATGRTLMIATSRPEASARQVLTYHGLLESFDLVAGSGAGYGDSKEAAVCRCLAKAKDSPVLAGDRIHDVEGGHACGIPVIGVLWGYGSKAELKQADFLVPDTAALSALLLNI